MINLLHEIRALWDMYEMSDLEDDEEDYLCELLDDWDDVQDRQYFIRKKKYRSTDEKVDGIDWKRALYDHVYVKDDEFLGELQTN